jgi:hypothetical protein
MMKTTIYYHLHKVLGLSCILSEFWQRMELQKSRSIAMHGRISKIEAALEDLEQKLKKDPEDAQNNS